MNIYKILTEIEKTDPEVYDKLGSRREVFKHFAGFGKKLAVAAVPLAFGSMFKKAYGQTSGGLIGILNYALTLEYLEAEFYTMAVAKAPGGSAGFIPSGEPIGAITTIRDHENAHVNFLKSAITAAGGTPAAKPTFDFSAGNGSNNGPFADVFTNYQTFLAVAQAFEDTGVRAYKGQADKITDNAVLTAALQIHSVEARHAAHIRRMRGQKGWITGKDGGNMPAATQAVYNGEENTNQAGVNVATLPGSSVNIGTEAFDEPLDMNVVLAIVDPFIV
ncbi:ferritin-like domain-containing protein [Adhaeribacter soli]|uniref:Ferritin-like domain-containing protein n=1 Tax=Adhaeribacter soli TaxID=2607655 RepID=A0A5N1J005_9BACT|nr:ferritin-like domain-containing protein [Adhaeribacter soli]KAA9333682.1 ferritin-like domain-containing protein [Adhaeribacter soli]